MIRNDGKPFVQLDTSVFLAPRDRHYPMTVAWSKGSQAINDVSTDLNTHDWTGYIKDGAVYVRRADLEEEHKLFDWDKEITQLDFCFDQNMRPTVVFVSEMKSYMYAFAMNDFSVIELDATIKSPRIALDNYLLSDIPQSDIILGYTYDGKLCYRVQRERYLKEYHVATDAKKSLLWRIGLMKDGRFGFQWR